MATGWESYITGPSGLMNRGPIESAGIFGTNGSTWSQSGINPTYEELLALANLYANPAIGYSEGFTLGGKKYALIRIDDDEIIHGRGKTAAGNTPNPITIMKTTQALVVAIGKEDANGGQVSMAVTVIGDYLQKAGY